MRLPVETLFELAAAVDPPGLDSAPPGSGSAPVVGSSPAPAPPPPNADRLKSPGRRTGVKEVVWVKYIKDRNSKERRI